MRYRLLTLLGIVTAFGVVFALTLRPQSVVAELRRDLHLPDRSRVWVVGDARPDGGVVVVTEIEEAFTIFYAGRMPGLDDVAGCWVRACYINPQTPIGQNAKAADIEQSLDHFPTQHEIEAFCSEHAIDVRL